MVPQSQGAACRSPRPQGAPLIATTFAEALRLTPTTDNGIGCALASGPDGAQIVPVNSYAGTARGICLRAFRESIGLTMGSASRVLGISVADMSGLETGRLTLDSATWARAEVALAVAAGPGWSGERADQRLRNALSWVAPSTGFARRYDFASTNVDHAAELQIHTVKRGALFCLAGWLAIEAGKPDEAVALAHRGIVPDIGPMPSWLAEGLLAVIGATVGNQ